MTDEALSPRTALAVVKTVHTVVWSMLVAAILAVPVAARLDAWVPVAVLVGLVSAECLVLALNGMQCPLTSMAARYTDDRRANFDIWLPEWLARNNKWIFGTLFAVDLAYTAMRFAR